MKRTFEYHGWISKKFWNIEIQGASVVITSGKLGREGQTEARDYPTEEAALDAYESLIEEKFRKGFAETTEPFIAQVSPEQQAFEDALEKDPDDLATHSAYADYLMEQGDPRGELIQVQLALENPELKEKDREQLRKRESFLIRRYGREWFADVGRFLMGSWSGPEKPYHFEVVRGWLDRVQSLPYPDPLFVALANAPAVRLLRRLEIVFDMRYYPDGLRKLTGDIGNVLRPGEETNDCGYSATILQPLLKSPWLRNLRSLKLGFSDQERSLTYSTWISPFSKTDARQLVLLLKRCPRLEELYLNTSLSFINSLFSSPMLANLRVLQFYYGHDSAHEGELVPIAYPLARLADNPAVCNLTTLRLHPGRDTIIDLDDFHAILHSPNLPSLAHLQVHQTLFGDEGCEAIIESGILKRLKTLDIGYGNMTDVGARRLAGCPDLKNLDELNVHENGLTPGGIQALEATGVRIVIGEQHDPEEPEHLYDVDWE